MYICCDCGEVFEKSDCGSSREYVGEFWGVDAYEDVACCPKCNSTCFDDALQCEDCGAWFSKNDLNNGFCEDCLDDVSAKDCFDVAKSFDTKRNVQLNSFIAEMFTAEEMEDILLEALVKCGANTSKYVNGDREWFAENLKELKGVIK